MISDLNGKVVLITGASTGIGAAAAVAFARLGCKLVVHYNESKAAAEAVAAEIKGLGASVTLAGGDVMQEAMQILETAFVRLDFLKRMRAGVIMAGLPEAGRLPVTQGLHIKQDPPMQQPGVRAGE